MFNLYEDDHFAPVDADGYAYCPKCKGPITADDAENYGECEDCWQAELTAQREYDAECDRLAAEDAARLAEPEPALCDGECPW